jgi:hypothetical protein
LGAVLKSISRGRNTPGSSRLQLTGPVPLGRKLRDFGNLY